MDYDFDNLNDKYSSASSTSSSTSESFVNNLKLKTTSPIKLNESIQQQQQQQHQQQQQINSFNTTMPNSCSLIFSTAASFNINQNDTVFYSRESIHLLAKFLANNSELSIFRSLYSYAPDNLAWLWSFLDWESPIDLAQIPTQDYYEPFEWCLPETTLSQSDDDLVNRINKIFADSPLIQYKYRENLMIADLYKFLEHLQKINLKYIAISLFNLYFPRFSCFMDDQIKPFLKPKILSSNLGLVKELDAMIIRLIKSRYSNLNEYKQKILTSTGLPSYVRSLINETGFWTNPTNKLLVQSLTTGLNTQKQLEKQKTSANLLSSQQDDKNLYQTLSYLKLLRNSTKINLDLDCTEDETGKEDDQEQDLIINALASPNLLDQSYYLNFSNANNFNNHTEFGNIGSPIPSYNNTPITNQNIANKILINTPQTPSNLNPYLMDKFDSNSSSGSSLWSNSNINSNKTIQQRYLSPPPSACLKSKLELNIEEDHFNTLSPLCNNNNNNNTNNNNNLIQSHLDPLMLTPSNFNEDQFSRYFNNTTIISSPIQKTPNYSNFVGSMNQNLNINTKFQQQQQQQQHQLANQNTKSPVGTRSPVYSNLLPNINHTWCGRLPPKIYSINSLFSRKVFLGGLPWDVNQQYLLQLLHKYGSVKLEIPGKDLKHPRVSNMNKLQERSTPGYVYIIFDHESAVQRMLADCRREYKNGGEHYYYNIYIPPSYNQLSGLNNQANFMKRGKTKEVEVIPWNQDDTSFVPLKLKDLPPKIDPKSTIFVGALHGMLNAQGLGKVMTEIFGEVIHAGLDTDKYKYPIGSGRVTFRDRASYVKAIKAKFVTIKANLDPSDPSPKFEKTIQIDPYLEDAKCSQCDVKSCYFCRNECCLDYYCMHCWSFRHDTKDNGEHVPLSRQNKPAHF